MRQVLLFLVSSLSLALAACGSSRPTDKASDDSQICIPEEYAVSLPSGGGPATSGLDPEGGGYGTSIRIGGEEVARLISDYRMKVRLGDKVYHQSLYVMLAPASEVSRTVPSSLSGEPLEGVSALLRTDHSPLAWTVIEQHEDGNVYWGNCSNTFTQPESFDCLRTLVIENLGLTYTIARENLPLYRDIDSLLRTKVNQWRCSTGGVPLGQ